LIQKRREPDLVIFMFDMSNVIKPEPLLKRELPERHTLIISPGKCGSTLLVKLLTLLGVETGYTKEAAMDKEYGSALEWPCRDEKADYYLSYRGNMPYLIKNNLLSLDLEEKIEKWDWHINHIYFLNRPTEAIVNRHFINRKRDERNINTRKETVTSRKEGLLGALARLLISNINITKSGSLLFCIKVPVFPIQFLSYTIHYSKVPCSI